MIKVEDTELDGVKVVTPRVFGDERGYFMESFNARDAELEGLPTEYAQDNHSQSVKGVLRGLHYQYPQWQAKLVRVVRGEIFDVAVDIRKGSKTFGSWVGIVLSEENKKQMFIPEGFAHGFLVLSERADFIYKCTTLYEQDQDRCLLWSDPDIGIDWPLTEPILSDKDKKGQGFATGGKSSLCGQRNSGLDGFGCGRKCDSR